MSDRLISADKAKEVLKHLLYETAMNNDLDIADIYEDIIENRLDTWIELVPTADAEPVRHGHWIFSQDDAEGTCSCCQYPIYGTPYYGQYLITPYSYCPNCGCKMDEDSNTQHRYNVLIALKKGEKMINDVLVPYVGEITLCTHCTNFIYPNRWKNRLKCWVCEDRRQKQIYEMLKLCERREDAEIN